ncbi:MAG: hypothetical protein ABIA11_01845 [Patescibacteria group bacterium]
MPEGPVLIIEQSFQKAWIAAAKKLEQSDWEIQTLMVTMQDSTLFDEELHKNFIDFAEDNGLIKPKDVAYTIFPHKLYDRCKNADKLFEEYNREKGLYDRLRKRPHRGWGTYFRRMTYYDLREGNIENQLDNIIKAINARKRIHKAAYTVVISKPGGETIKPLGGPCLNYLTIQLHANPKKIDILALYRNHDFLERAYGNYWGLCNLLRFMANEINFYPGSLTCVSSHAYVASKKGTFKIFVDSLS